MLILSFLFSQAAALSFHLASPRQRWRLRRHPGGRRHAGLLALVSLLCAMQALGPAPGLLAMLAMTALGLLVVPRVAAGRSQVMHRENA